MLHEKYYAILPVWENHRVKGGFAPLFYEEGLRSPPDKRKEGGTMYVTYSDLIQTGILIVALIDCVIQSLRERNSRHYRK
ncbi:MAG TPA: hypothetical protein DCZ23_07690, partial [Lachnospiraceae bacterium]|nr:hypothetical protein [Lachnospiraceae bacterium]